MRRHKWQSTVVEEPASSVTAESKPLAVARVLALQRSAGNAAVGRLLRSRQGSPMPGLAPTNPAPLLDEDGEDEEQEQTEPIQAPAPLLPPAREDRAPKGPLPGPTLGFEFQSFWTLRRGTSLDPVVNKSDKLLIDKIAREEGGEPLVLWHISPDAPNSSPGQEGKQLTTSYKVLEFVTNVLRPAEYKLARERMQLFIQILRTELQGKPSVSFNVVWQQWSAQVKTLGALSPACSDLSIGHDSSQEGAAPWSKDDQAKVTPQMTFDIALADIPVVFEQLIDRGVGTGENHARMQGLLKECKIGAAKFTLSPTVFGLATLLLWEMKMPRLISQKPLYQQKPYHLFMLRRSFHALYTSLSESEKSEWASFAASVTDTGEIYPTKAFTGSDTVTRADLAKTVAEPLSVLSRDEKRALISAIRNAELTGPLTTQHGQVLFDAIKRPRGAMPLDAVGSLANLRTALDDLIPLLPPEVALQVTAITSRDVMSRATGEAVGKWPARTGGSVVATFEWRGMRGDWKDIEEWLARAATLYTDIKGLDAA